MAKIIRLDKARLSADRTGSETSQCTHKSVTVYTAQRTVHCSNCNALLDPFDTLVDMVQSLPPEGDNDDLNRFLREVKKRKPSAE